MLPLAGIVRGISEYTAPTWFYRATRGYHIYTASWHFFSAVNGLQMLVFCASGAHVCLYAARRFSKTIIFDAFPFENGRANITISGMTHSKQTLRQEARRKRAGQAPNAAAFNTARDLFFNYLDPKPPAIIAGYWPTGSEFDVTPILEEVLQRGLTCALPVIPENGRILQFAKWTKDTSLTEGQHGVFYPQGTELLIPDIVIVPLLAFDHNGGRLGQGGGYYDATLADLRAKRDILAIGLAYAVQACLSDLPAEPHDQRLDMVITPAEVFDFRK